MNIIIIIIIIIIVHYKHNSFVPLSTSLIDMETFAVMPW